jgi:hypothetical protein
MATPHINVKGIWAMLTADECAAVSMVVTPGYTYLKHFIPPVTGDNHELCHKARYIWRWVSFNVSTNRDEWVPPDEKLWKGRFDDKERKRLDEIVALIINTVPKHKWYGAKYQRKLMEEQDGQTRR